MIGALPARCGVPAAQRGSHHGPATTAAPARLSGGTRAARTAHGATRSATSAQWFGSRRSPLSVAVRAASEPQSGSAVPDLQDLPMQPILNVHGFVLHELDAPMEAAVFAIYDQQKKLQFVGFSKDINHSLRTVFARRPDKAYYFRAHYQSKMDPDNLGATRAAWFAANEGPPPGNAVAMETVRWTKPFEAWATSDKGKLMAATEDADVRMKELKSRGCKEIFIPDPDLLKEGKVDFLPAKELTPEQLEENKRKMAAIEASTRVTHIEHDGNTEELRVFFKSIFVTNGGSMCDISVVHDMRETTHRIIVGKEFYEPYGVSAEAVVECAVAFMLQKRMARRTEGILSSTEFPVNYFSVSELVQWNDDFQPFFETRVLGGTKSEELPGGKAWRWARTEYYGHEHQDNDVEGLKIAFGFEAEEEAEQEPELV